MTGYASPLPADYAMIARFGATRIETLPTGHLPMLGKPAELAAILNNA